jgi:8-amino-7-oxononanoate synthase
MADFLDWIPAELGKLRDAGLLRQRRSVTPLPDGWCAVNGRRLRNFAGNDYLNLAHDPRVIAAASDVLKQGGVGVTASALVSGRTVWHDELERRLAALLGVPAALLFPTGFAANLGTLATLAGPGDAVCCDRLNHASLVDGCRLSGARLRIYRHTALDRLERELKAAAGARRRFIVTDSLFSMDGDLAPLAELCDLAERYAAILAIDEAHAFGVLGPQGRGAAELLQVESRIPIRIGTLSKAVGSLGGFVAGSQELIDWLWNTARPHMFSTALPPALCAAALCALQIMQAEPCRREQVQARAAQLRTGLRELQLESTAVDGPIVPVILAANDRAVTAARLLEERGYLVGAIRPPTVPHNTSRLRITLTAAHTPEDVTGLLTALASIFQSSISTR